MALNKTLNSCLSHAAKYIENIQLEKFLLKSKLCVNQPSGIIYNLKFKKVTETLSLRLKFLRMHDSSRINLTPASIFAVLPLIQKNFYSIVDENLQAT